jgi:DNA-binding CsgD family transcriptional regulator
MMSVVQGLRHWKPVAEEVVGRESELAEVADFLRVVERASAAFVAAGEPGIGKTRLWQTAVEAARAQGVRVLACRAAESEVRLSFVCLGDLLDEPAGEVLPVLAAPQRAAVEAALRLRDPAAAYVDRHAVGRGLLEILRYLLAERALLIAIDDVQWIDRSSAAALEFALRRLESERFGLLATLRAEGEAPCVPTLAAVLGEERVRMLSLGPLDARALHTIIRARIGVVLPHPLLRRVHEATGGNPFFALEISRALAAARDTGAGGVVLPVPENLRVLLRARLERLSPPMRRLALAAAAVPRPTRTLLRSYVGDERAEADLERAVGAGVLEIDGDLVRFAHPLLASVCYAEASPEVRRRVHREFAAIVTDAEERARHLALAAARPDPTVASSLDEAARLARARGAPEAAAELLELARSLTRAADRAAGRRRLLDCADCWLEAGDTGRARLLLEQAAICSRPGDEHSEALNLLAQTHWFGNQREAVRLFSEIRREAESGRIRAASELGLATAMRHLSEDLPSAAAHARAAVELAEEGRDRAALAQALMESALLETMVGGPSALALMRRALSLEPAVLSLRVLRHPAYLSVLVLIMVDRWDEARLALETVWARAEGRGDDNARAWIAYFMSVVERLAGDFAAAARWADDGYEAALESGQESSRLLLLAARAAIEADRGILEGAYAAVEEALTGATETGMAPARTMSLAALGSLELSLGRAAEAHRALAPIVAECAKAGLYEPGALRFVADEIEALIALGELAQARRLLEPLEERCRKLGRTSVGACCARCRALLLASERDFEGAELALQEALALHEHALQPLERARTLAALGAVRRRRRRNRAARTALEEALAAFEALGASAWAERALAELRRIGGRTPAGDRLTTAERRVAELVAAGRTNREIGSELFISVRTVESNLAKSFRKLGVRSRTELAALLLADERRAPVE